MFANAFVMSNSAAGAISVRPEAAGTASDVITREKRVIQYPSAHAMKSKSCSVLDTRLSRGTTARY
jgi:hypothetical protein